MLVGSAGVTIVCDGRGAYQGVVDIDTIITSIKRMVDENAEYYRLAKLDGSGQVTA